MKLADMHLTKMAATWYETIFFLDSRPVSR